MVTKNDIVKRRSNDQRNGRRAFWPVLSRGRDDLFSEMIVSMDRMFDEFFRSCQPEFQTAFGPTFFEKGSYPKVDVLNTPNSVVIEAAVPGMSKEDITIEILDGTLTISGEKQQEEDRDGSTYMYRELKRSSFRRSWVLNENLDQEDVSAQFKDGMLYLTIPKVKPEEIPKPEPRQIEIK